MPFWNLGKDIQHGPGGAEGQGHDGEAGLAARAAGKVELSLIQGFVMSCERPSGSTTEVAGSVADL